MVRARRGRDSRQLHGTYGGHDPKDSARNIKSRLEKLEQAAPKGDHLSVCWRSVLTCSGDVLTEAVRSAHILGSDTAPGESHVRRPGESQQVFVRHVLDRACIIWNRHDEAFRDGIRWAPQPETYLTR